MTSIKKEMVDSWAEYLTEFSFIIREKGLEIVILTVLWNKLQLYDRLSALSVGNHFPFKTLVILCRACSAERQRVKSKISPEFEGN